MFNLYWVKGYSHQVEGGEFKRDKNLQVYILFLKSVYTEILAKSGTVNSVNIPGYSLGFSQCIGKFLYAKVKQIDYN